MWNEIKNLPIEVTKSNLPLFRVMELKERVEEPQKIEPEIEPVVESVKEPEVSKTCSWTKSIMGKTYTCSNKAQENGLCLIHA